MDYASFVISQNTKGDFNPEAIKAAAKAKAGGSNLVQMAIVLGMVADSMMKEIENLALELGKVQQANIQKTIDNPKAVPDKESENILSARLQAQTQILNMFMQAMSNAIKTVGEAAATTARKG